jgi:ribosomal protein L4
MIVLAQSDANVWKSFRNFPGVKVRLAQDLNAFDVIGGGLIVAEKAALDALAQRVGVPANAKGGVA